MLNITNAEKQIINNLIKEWIDESNCNSKIIASYTISYKEYDDNESIKVLNIMTNKPDIFFGENATLYEIYLAIFKKQLNINTIIFSEFPNMISNFYF